LVALLNDDGIPLGAVSRSDASRSAFRFCLWYRRQVQAPGRDWARRRRLTAPTQGPAPLRRLDPDGRPLSGSGSAITADQGASVADQSKPALGRCDPGMSAASVGKCWRNRSWQAPSQHHQRTTACAPTWPLSTPPRRQKCQHWSAIGALLASKADVAGVCQSRPGVITRLPEKIIRSQEQPLGVRGSA
jgi:hypothetical protein